MSAIAINSGYGPIGRPMLSSTGNVYLVTYLAASSAIAILKATDPTVAFNEVASGSRPTHSISAIGDIDFDQVSDVIHIVSTAGIGSTGSTVKYHTFNMATDAYVVKDETVFTSSSNASSRGMVGVRVSDGHVFCLYRGDKTNNMGTNYSTVFYKKRSGGTWGTAVQVFQHTIAASEAGALAVIQGSSSRMHLCYDTNNTGAVSAVQKTVTSADVLQAQTSSNPYGTQGQPDRTSATAGTIYMGETRAPGGIIYPDAFVFTSADSPSAIVDDGPVGSTLTNNGTNVWSQSGPIVYDGTTRTYIFAENGKLYRATKTGAVNTTAYTTQAALWDSGTTTDVIYPGRANRYNRLSVDRVAFWFNDNTTGVNYYDEYPQATPPPPVPPPRQLGSRLAIMRSATH